MKQEELSWTSSDGLNIYGTYWAPDEAPVAVICLVHGMGEHINRYSHMAEFFCERNIAIIGYDHRGHGKSGGKRGHSPSYNHLLDGIDDLLKQANDKWPNVPKFLFGHSMGGNLVANYAIVRKPEVKGVILSAPYFRLSFSPSTLKVGLGKFASRILPGLIQPTGLDPTSVSRDKEVVDAYVADPLVHDKISAAFFMGVHTAGEVAINAAPDLQIPTLLYHGSADKLTSPEASEEFAKNANGFVTFKLWDGLYHESHNEPEKEEVFNYIYAWMDGLLKN